MSFFEKFLDIISEWKNCFAQKRTLNLAIRQSLAILCTTGRKTITQAISFSGRDHLDWSSEYKLHSRSKWLPEDLFQPVIKCTVPFFSQSEYISVAVDDTKLKKSGKKIPHAQYHRDPLSPPFHTNFLYGLRILQISATLPLYDLYSDAPISSRGIPVRFSNVPVIKKPGKKATEEEIKNYMEMKKTHNLSVAALEAFKDIRSRYDAAGAYDKRIIYTCDGSFCNKTIFTESLDRGDVLARTRKDAKLCFPAKEGSGKVYSKDKFTPESVRTDNSIFWTGASVFLGGKFRLTKYKEVKGILWQRGAKRKHLRLIVIASTPYRNTKNGRTYYRDPAYLFTTNMEIPAEKLIQVYLDRWEIEVNHRDEKTVLGIGQAQVRNTFSVLKQPAFAVASYSILLLAAIFCLGPYRTNDYTKLPKWRRNARRPSCQDMISLLRKEIPSEKELVEKIGMNIDLVRACIKSVA